jgi:hypothetical protein
MRNRYLLTSSGRDMRGRFVPFLFMLGPVLVMPLFFIVGVALESALLCALGVLCLVAGIVPGWVFLIRGAAKVRDAGQAWLAGSFAVATEQCRYALSRVFRSDVRTKAFHVLGLCAEANGDFAEALDLFECVQGMVPAFGTATNKKRAHVLVQSHRALCLVALGRIEEADTAVRSASMAFAQPAASSALGGFLLDDEAFGPIGVNTALAQMEPGRDPRALLTLATVVLLAARGMAREAIDLVERERATLGRGLLPREQALLRGAEAKARRALAGGIHRAAEAPEETVDPWAARVLAVAR